jgi:hypothetical protein
VPETAARSARTQDDVASLAAIGILAACFTMVAHEALGHAVVCVAAGGHVVTLSSAFFRCSVDEAVIDAAGPLANMVLGAGSYVALQRARSPEMFLFLLMLAGFNLYLGAGTLIYSGLLDVDDWAIAARDLAAPPAWRPCAIIVGAALYALLTWQIGRRAGRTFGPTYSRLVRLIRVPYLAGSAAVCLSCAFNSATPVAAVVQGALEIGIASCGFLRASRFAAQPQRMTDDHDRFDVPSSPSWIVASLVTLGIFIATLGRGFG